MPGVLSAATVSPTATVLPQSLSLSFTEMFSYPVMQNEYADGTIQRSIIQDGVNSPRNMRRWQMDKRLTTTQLTALRTFFITTVVGGLKPFYFYNPYAPAPGSHIGSNYDATGVSTQGRVTVVFTGNWSERTLIGRHEVGPIGLVEIA